MMVLMLRSTVMLSLMLTPVPTLAPALTVLTLRSTVISSQKHNSEPTQMKVKKSIFSNQCQKFTLYTRLRWPFCYCGGKFGEGKPLNDIIRLNPLTLLKG